MIRTNVKRSFATKLMLALAGLAALMGAMTAVVSYRLRHGHVLESMQGRLSDVAHTGSFLFDQNSREMIKELSQELLKRTEGKRTAHAEMTLNDLKQALTPEEAERLMQRPDFLELVQRLRQIKAGSTRETRALHNLKQNEWPEDVIPEINFAYLFVAMPETDQVVMFLADSDYEPFDENGDGTIEEDERGNPIGNMYVPEPFFLAPFKDGGIHVAESWYTDPWGTFISAAVPIKDRDEKVIAVLGVDYRVDSEGNKLRRSTMLAIALASLSVLLSIAAGAWIGRVLARPIKPLVATAERLSQRDFSARADVRSNDELGLLGHTVNAMALEIEQYANEMEALVAKRTQALADANASILKLNERLKSENMRMSAELEVAHRLQTMGLPSAQEWQSVRGFEIASHMQPAAEVGGDYFDLLHVDEQGALLGIGDVSGHGLDSGVVMLMVQAALRALALTGPEERLRHYDLVNRLLCSSLARMSMDKNMTLCLLALRQDGACTIVGQHEAPLLVRANGEVEWVDTMALGVPLGIDPELASVADSHSFWMSPGDTLLLYTDGLTEARGGADADGSRPEFGNERLAAIIRDVRSASAHDQLEHLRRALNIFTAGHELDDDVTLLVIRRR